MKILVCGGRDYNNVDNVYAVLNNFIEKITVLINGGAKGADTHARNWAISVGIPTWTFTADWITHGNQAGPIRNKEMLTKSEPDLVIAFPGGKGTKHMIDIAKLAGIEVLKITDL